jgi:HD superfamily phosphohydrolase
VSHKSTADQRALNEKGTERLRQVKIINDPVHGFISIPYSLVESIIDHPYFQRLRHIKQLGLTHLVYPGALHTRFHHAMGAFHLITKAFQALRQKGVELSDDDLEAAQIAILMHDIGHGPFSHALEATLVNDISHEEISGLLMQQINRDLDGKIDKAIAIFEDQYGPERHFLHELVASQLDMDRLDYLARDSFYTGVSEGVIGVERIIEMLAVRDGRLAVEHKGIYSIEKFLISRRLMYWQVYLHKTVVSAEKLLLKILLRAQELAQSGKSLFATPNLQFFLHNRVTGADFRENSEVIATFASLDDHDIMAAVKVWAHDDDRILAMLCQNMLERNLFKTVIRDAPFAETEMDALRAQVAEQYGIGYEEASYLAFSGSLTNAAYEPNDPININILFRNGELTDITQASDQYNISALSRTVQKYFLCYPKRIAEPVISLT